jgi:hypothetical protein
VLLLGLQALLTDLDGHRQVFDPAERKATVILFVSTVCPVSGDYYPRIVQLWSEFGKRRDVNFLVVFPNKTEPLTDVRRYAAEMQFPFAVYRDDGNVLADAVGALVTPTAAVLDRGGTVTYIGAIDDAANPARVKRRYLSEAIRATLAGRRPADGIQTPYGCRIKRVARP